MHINVITLSLAMATGRAAAESYYMFSGAFGGSTISALKFNTTDLSLTLVRNVTINTTSNSKWITLDARRKNLYVCTTGAYQSYAITQDMNLVYQSNITTPPNCTSPNHIVSMNAEPFTVFGAEYNQGCPASAISVSTSGAMQAKVAEITYDDPAGVHGLALSPHEDFVYSADDMGDAVWAHWYDRTTNAVNKIQKINAPTGSSPRHLTVHPNGNWVYVLYELANSVAIYSRDSHTGLLTDTNISYPLVPPSYTNTSYWSDEILFSVPSSTDKAASPKYLVASTRSRTAPAPGFVSAFSLNPETGAIVKQLFLVPTTGTGGAANAVTPALFSENYFALTDSADNFVEIWKFDESSAAPVARLDIANPANVVWLN